MTRFCYGGILAIALNITIHTDYEMREARQEGKPHLSLFSFHANLRTTINIYAVSPLNLQSTRTFQKRYLPWVIIISILYLTLLPHIFIFL